MSHAFSKEFDTEQRSDDQPERPQSEVANYVTPQGLQALQASLQTLEAEHARLQAQGDELTIVQQLQAIERDIRYYQQRIETAMVIPPPPDEKTVRFGAKVTVRDTEHQIHHFTIVGEDEADIEQGKISWVSPLAKALLNGHKGDKVVWERPAGKVKLTITAIEY